MRWANLIIAALWALAAVLFALADRWLMTGLNTVLAVGYLVIWLNTRHD